MSTLLVSMGLLGLGLGAFFAGSVFAGRLVSLLGLTLIAAGVYVLGTSPVVTWW